MADFREELVIQCTNDFAGLYKYAWTKYDIYKGKNNLVDIESGGNLSLGDACKIINHFVCGSLATRKECIMDFIAHDELFYSEEY